MKKFFLTILLLSLPHLTFEQEFFFPVKLKNRQSVAEIELTPIGEFARWRIKWKSNPPHYHTGVDIKRPNLNYINEPIFPIAFGRVISVRNDGPNSQIIIEHHLQYSIMYWSVYEHVAGIMVKPDDNVDPFQPIARFMSKNELNRFGWHFDHVHLEILKKSPLKIKPSPKHPFWKYQTYSLVCFNEKTLYQNYYNPLKFISLNQRK